VSDHLFINAHEIDAAKFVRDRHSDTERYRIESFRDQSGSGWVYMAVTGHRPGVSVRVTIAHYVISPTGRVWDVSSLVKWDENFLKTSEVTNSEIVSCPMLRDQSYDTSYTAQRRSKAGSR
jgi:hypothetical protein